MSDSTHRRHADPGGLTDLLLQASYALSNPVSAVCTRRRAIPCPLRLRRLPFLGRSNVGKSSLLNALVGQIQPSERARRRESGQGLANAGPHPRDHFFALLDQKQKSRLVFADLPGYGYAKISKSISAEWPKFIEPYLADRETLKLCICLVDSNIPPQQSDGKLFEWLRHAGRDFLVVATKTDRLSGNARTRNLQAIRSEFGLDEVLPVSAKTGTGIKELWTRLEASES